MSENILGSRIYCRSCKIKQLHEVVKNDTDQLMIYKVSRKEKIKSYRQDLTDLDVSEGLAGLDEDGFYELIDFMYFDDYAIVKCRGCGDTVSFVHMSTHEHHLESAEGEYDPYTYSVYPKPPKRRIINNQYNRGKYSHKHVPLMIKELREEVVNAFEQDMILLCIVGLRMLTEAICQEHKEAMVPRLNPDKTPMLDENGNISMKFPDLKRMIDRLRDNYIITEQQRLILQDVRELGNKAVHHFTRQDKDLIRKAINILDNLLYNIFDLREISLNSKESPS